MCDSIHAKLLLGAAVLNVEFSRVETLLSLPYLQARVALAQVGLAVDRFHAAKGGK